jgi:hypothetical protein
MLYVIIYISAICTANIIVSEFGPVVIPLNAFSLIALDMTLRDKLHDMWAGGNITLRMLWLILTAGIISYIINPETGVIAIASVSAFTLSAATDSFVYQMAISRRWLVKSNASNVAGAAVDSLVFPLVAFGSFMPMVILAQFTAKTIGGIAWSIIIAKYRRKK